MSNLSLREFWIRLNNHDWLYQYSDDHRVYMRGHRELLELQALCVLGEVYQNLYKDFQRWGLMLKYKDPKTGEYVRYSKPRRPIDNNSTEY